MITTAPAPAAASTAIPPGAIQSINVTWRGEKLPILNPITSVFADASNADDRGPSASAGVISSLWESQLAPGTEARVGGLKPENPSGFANATRIYESLRDAVAGSGLLDKAPAAGPLQQLVPGIVSVSVETAGGMTHWNAQAGSDAALDQILAAAKELRGDIREVRD